MDEPDANSEPVGIPNSYDWGSPEDEIVTDPLSDDFLSLWDSRAKQNTDVFRRVFHAVPDNSLRTWSDYRRFTNCFARAEDTRSSINPKKPSRRMVDNLHAGNEGKVRWGHVVASDFSPGDEGIRQVKGLLSQVRGTLVEMPLDFLVEEDVAKSGATLNAFTEWVYT